MRIPTLTDIIQAITENQRYANIADTETGDSTNTNITVPVVPAISGTVTYYKSTVTQQPAAKIEWSWPTPVIYDENGTAVNVNDPDILDDLHFDPVTDYYFGVAVGTSPVVFASTKGSNTITTANHSTGVDLTGYVYAVTKYGIKGPVTSSTITVARDLTAPPKPNTPVVSSYLGGLVITDNNKDASNNTMPPDKSYTLVEASINNATWAKLGIIYGAGGSMTVNGLEVGTLHYIRFSAFDSSNNQSTYSNSATATPRNLVELDFSPGSITETLIADNAISTPKICADAIEAHHIKVGAIEANKLASTIVLTTDILTGDPDTTHVEITPQGMVAYVHVPDLGTVVKSVSLGTEDSDLIRLYDASGNPTISMGADGTGVFKGLNVTDKSSGLYIYGTEFTEYFNRYPKGLIAWKRATGNLTATSLTEVIYPSVECRAILEPGRSYRIEVSDFFADASAANTEGAARIRYTIGGLPLSVTGTELRRSEFLMTSSNALQQAGFSGFIDTTGLPAPTEYRFGVTLCRQSGTGTITFATGSSPIQNMRVAIYDEGLSVPESSATVRYVSQWDASNTTAFDQYGFQRTDDTYYSYTNAPMTVGNCYGTAANDFSLAWFNGTAITGDIGKTIPEALAGATIEKVEVYLQVQVVGNEDNGLSYFTRTHSTTDQTVTTFTPPGGSDLYAVKTTGQKTGVSKWVNITSIWDSSSRGIIIGQANTTALTWHGHIKGVMDPNRPILKITYRR